MAEAFAQTTSDRQRPVAVEVPRDSFANAAVIEAAAPVTGHRPADDPDQIAAAVELLKAANTPMIMVGGGAQAASAEVPALAPAAGGPKVLRVDIDPTEMVRLKPDLGSAAGPTTADGLASSVAIAPTLLGRVGVPRFHGMQGRSFLGQLTGGAPARDPVLIELEKNRLSPGVDRRPNMRHLIAEGHRLTIYKGCDFGKRYELEADPNEPCTLCDTPAAARQQAWMMAILAQAMLEAIDPGPAPKRYA